MSEQLIHRNDILHKLALQQKKYYTYIIPTPISIKPNYTNGYTKGSVFKQMYEFDAVRSYKHAAKE